MNGHTDEDVNNVCHVRLYCDEIRRHDSDFMVVDREFEVSVGGHVDQTDSVLLSRGEFHFKLAASDDAAIVESIQTVEESII